MHLIPYFVLVAFSHIFSVGPLHIGHLKFFIHFHPKPKKWLRKSQERISCRFVLTNFFTPLVLCCFVFLSLPINRFFVHRNLIVNETNHCGISRKRHLSYEISNDYLIVFKIKKTCGFLGAAQIISITCDL
jgi:hypothetical protein